MIQRGMPHTQSERAWKILAMWDDMLPRFVKVMPRDYQRMLEAIQRAEAAGSVAMKQSWWPLKKIKTMSPVVSGN